MAPAASRMPTISSTIELRQLLAEPFQLLRRGIERRCTRRRRRLRLTRPAVQQEHQYRAGNDNQSPRQVIAEQVESAPRRGHQCGLPILGYKRIDHLLRRLALPREAKHFLVERGAVGAAKIRRATCVDVEPAAAGAAELLRSEEHTSE